MLINLTPHEIRIRVFNPTDRAPEPRADDVVIPSSGVARLETVYEHAYSALHPLPGGDVGEDVRIPAVRATYGAATGLPEPRGGVGLIVSLPLLLALRHTRPDLLAPDSGETAIRDARGQIFAVTRLVR